MVILSIHNFTPSEVCLYIKFYIFYVNKRNDVKIVPLILKKEFFCFHTFLYFHVKCLLGLINWESGILFEYHFFFFVNCVLNIFKSFDI